MGLLDSLMGQAGGVGGLASLAMKNPQVLSAVASLLSTRDTSVGGAGGLGGLMNAFAGKGLGDMMSSWISTGPNPAISAPQVTEVLGADTLAQFASKAGVAPAEAGGLLATFLPAVVDHLTPDGKVPETNALESALGGLLSSFGR